MATQKIALGRARSAVFASLAVAAGTAALLTNHFRKYEELRRRLDRIEQDGQGQRHADLSRQQRLLIDLLGKAMDDPDLAAVLDTYETEVPARTQRQFLFANALYTNALHAYHIGVVNQEELRGHLRIICQNAIFRQYWEATRHHRASLKDASDEARLGRMVDQLIQDLDDAEEWWVAGELPGDFQ
jgi:type II secretory pathway component PulJ